MAFLEGLSGYSASELRIIDASGKAVLTSTPWRGIETVAWSPDGREVWLSGSKDSERIALWAISLTGDERVVYQGADPLLVWDVRQDGRILASMGRYRYEMAGREPGQSVERDLTWLGRSSVTDLSADGRSVLFEDGQFAKDRAFMFLRGTDGTDPARRGHTRVDLSR